MPIIKRPLPDGRPVSQGFNGYECSECGVHSYNPNRIKHRPGCPEAEKKN